MSGRITARTAAGSTTSPPRTRTTLREGEKRRLTVGAMLATRPRVCVLDEPTFETGSADLARDGGESMSALAADGIRRYRCDHPRPRPARHALGARGVPEWGRLGTIPVSTLARGPLSGINPVAKLGAAFLIAIRSSRRSTGGPGVHGRCSRDPADRQQLEAGLSWRGFWIRTLPVWIAAPLAAVSIALYGEEGGGCISTGGADGQRRCRLSSVAATFFRVLAIALPGHRSVLRRRSHSSRRLPPRAVGEAARPVRARRARRPAHGRPARRRLARAGSRAARARSWPIAGGSAA